MSMILESTMPTNKSEVGDHRRCVWEILKQYESVYA